MAECQVSGNSSNLNEISNSSKDSEKQDCTSPSPTETVCLDQTCSESAPGTSQDHLAPLSERLDEIYRSQAEEENKTEKTNFLNELGLEECEDEDSCDKDENWEDCTEGEFSEENRENELDEVFFSSSVPVPEVVNFHFPKKLLQENEAFIKEISQTSRASNNTTPRSSCIRRCTFETTERYIRKRKLDAHNGLPCKKLLPDRMDTTNETCAADFGSSSGNSTVPDMCVSDEPPSDDAPLSPTMTAAIATTPRSSRLGIRTNARIKNCFDSECTSPGVDPPEDLPNWLNQFQKWKNPERILAINALIARCEPTQVRYMMQVIEPQFQRDFISLLPRELALNVLSFLEPKDLLKAAQTCRSWRFLAEDNLLWKEKCRQAGIELPKRRNPSSRPPSTGALPWKAAYMRQHTIETNWRTKPIRPPKMLKGHDDHVITCLQFCGNRIVSGSDDNTLKVWSAVTGKCLRTLVGHTGGVWSSQMSGGTIISGSTDRTLKVWDAETGVCIHTLYGHTSTVRCMHLHGNTVVSGSRDATLRVWDVETGVCQHVLVGHLAAVRCVQYDGKLVVSGAYDYMVKVWNPDREECLHTLQGHTNRVYSLQFDGVHVVSGSLDTSIRVWEVETGACKHTLMGHQSLTSGMELRNNILVSGNADSTVKVWDIVTGQCLQTLSGPYKHQSAVTCLQFNNRFVITSSDDGTVKLWDVRTGEFIRNLVALDSGGSGGVVWRIRANDTKLVCAVGSRNGTEETKLLVLDFDVESNMSAVISR